MSMGALFNAHNPSGVRGKEFQPMAIQWDPKAAMYSHGKLHTACVVSPKCVSRSNWLEMAAVT